MIRKYQAADCDAVLNVWAAASAVAHAFLGRDFLDRERRTIPEVYLPVADTWVWDADGRIVGFMSLLGSEVGAIFVDPAVQRSGIGRALLDHARQRIGALEVEVFTDNLDGRAFYARYGFELMHSRIHAETGFEVLRLRYDPPRGG